MAEAAPMPAFYCCYLLRAKNRKSYYIGSTPNPARRLAQHNGCSKGGAKRTAMESKRPWEMTCIVTGFPSKFAALQFEWAWQNAYITRHIDRHAPDEAQKPAASPTKRRSRPPMSLEARLKNLHNLLCAKSFARWPLNIRFFASDVFALWGKYTAKLPTELRKSISVQLTPAGPAVTTTNVTAAGDTTYTVPDAIREISVAYEDCKSHVEKAKRLLEGNQRHTCGLCRKSVDTLRSLVSVCPLHSCTTVSHLACLSAKFLAEEGDRSSIIPIEGRCPGCGSLLKWTTLMKELSLRTRGQAEVEALLKPKRRRKGPNVLEAEAAPLQALDEDDEDLDETWTELVEDEGEEFPSIDSYLAPG